MPISSKKIISNIVTLKKGFTKSALQKSIISSKIEKKKSGKSKKKKTYNPNKDINRIETTLVMLTQAGFLRTEGSSFVPVNNLTCSGIIHVNTSKSGMLITETSEQILIPSTHLNGARDGDTVHALVVDIKRGFIIGKVCSITARHREQFVAKIITKTRERIFYSLLDTRDSRELFSPRFKGEPEVGEYIVVTLNELFEGSRQQCAVEGSYSPLDESFDFQRISLKHVLPGPHKEYEELTDPESIITSREMKNRKDYRDLYTVTIDGEHAKDFDDALSIEKKGNAFTLYVHIADVSAYVKKNSVLDREALKRGTSYYLGDRVIPMFPELLSNTLCSLTSDTDKLCMTAVMTFDQSGKMTNPHFSRSLIRVNKRLTYKSSTAILSSDKKNDTWAMLTLLHQLAYILKRKRVARGRLDLNLPDVELKYEKGVIKDIIVAERLDSHTIVEECMLSANEAVSKALKDAGMPTLYRVHEEMSPENVFALKRFLKMFSIKLKSDQNIGVHLQDILAKVAGLESEQVINLVILKSLMQAFYGIEPLGHFGLGFEDYTHFTSPIRRYPDLVVHRCLKCLIDDTKPPYTVQELIEIGEQTSDRERIAQRAERDLIKLKSCRLLQERIGDTFNAIISGIAKSGLFVSLLDIPAEGMVPLKSLTDDYYLVMETEYSVIGRRYSQRYTLGDKIKVKLTAAEIETMRIDFEIIQK